MALKAIVDKVEDLPEAIQGEYTKMDDGRYRLIVTPVEGFELDDVGSLKNALGAERTAKAQLEKDFLKFKDLDPVKARDALKKLKELGDIDPEKEADKLANTKFEAAKSQLLEKHESEVKARDERNGFLTKKLENLLIDQVATTALAEAKGSVTLLLPHVRANTRVVEDNGDFKVEVIDKQQNVRIGDSKGAPMTIKDLVTEMRNSDEFGRAFEGDGTSGGGKRPGNGGGGTPTLKRSTMSAKEKGDYAREHGQDAFLKLPFK